MTTANDAHQSASSMGITNNAHKIHPPMVTPNEPGISILNGGTTRLAGKSIDSSMGFTPAGGMIMGTRSGDLDPGVETFLTRTGQMDSEQFYAMANRESGLLGVSAFSSDLRELLAVETENVFAAETVALFCYQATKYIGAYTAALGGLDTLVFAGGIGENSPQICQCICANLGILGLTLNQVLNQARDLADAPIISVDRSAVSVRIIATNEELIIAHAVRRVLSLS